MLSIAPLFDPQTLDSLCLSASWCKKYYLLNLLRRLLDLTNSVDKQMHIRITLLIQTVRGILKLSVLTGCLY